MQDYWDWQIETDIISSFGRDHYQELAESDYNYNWDRSPEGLGIEVESVYAV